MSICTHQLQAKAKPRAQRDQLAEYVSYLNKKLNCRDDNNCSHFPMTNLSHAAELCRR